ncbi:MAG: HpcH/HpaI aldolase/citrate lyase family protein [Dehalococcoidia bacterium]
MRNNPLKEKLGRGEAVIGAFGNILSPTVVEILGLVGLDFLTLDAEHTAMSPETCEELCRAAELRGVTAVTRVGENSQQVIQKFLDAGSMGVFVPIINTRKEAQRVVDAVKYPPAGKRGLAGTRAAEWGLTAPLGEYVQTANRETLVGIQVETREGFENFPEILSVEGIDVILFGPTDISAALGMPGKLNDPAVRELIERLGQETIAAGKHAGTLTRTAEEAIYWRERGFQWLATGVTTLLISGAQRFLQGIREHQASRS